jgi:hypothetical protein
MNTEPVDKQTIAGQTFTLSAHRHAATQHEFRLGFA